jgi:hypothetical protein
VEYLLLAATLCNDASLTTSSCTAIMVPSHREFQLEFLTYVCRFFLSSPFNPPSPQRLTNAYTASGTMEDSGQKPTLHHMDVSEFPGKVSPFLSLPLCFNKPTQCRILLIPLPPMGEGSSKPRATPGKRPCWEHGLWTGFKVGARSIPNLCMPCVGERKHGRISKQKGDVTRPDAGGDACVDRLDVLRHHSWLVGE